MTATPWDSVLNPDLPDSALEAHDRLCQLAEDAVIEERGPLTRRTSEADWYAYWMAVADKVKEANAS